jgi:catechol 2,3-dioxygenase-like lactoylglutathione lyase family enzyme
MIRAVRVRCRRAEDQTMETVSSRRAFIKRALAAGASASAIVAAAGGQADAQTPTSHIRGFDHVALPMQKVDAMLAFYRALGLQVIEGAQACSVHFGSQMINFHRPSAWQNASFTLRAPAAAPPCGDLCFVWDDTPAALSALLASAGATIETGPVARQGGRQIAGSSVYVRDPDGNLLEFIVY